MLLYFIIRVSIALGLSFLLLLLFLRAAKKYKKEVCKQTWQVFWPTVLAIALLLQASFSTAPKLLDSIAVIRNAMLFKQVTVSTRHSLPGNLKSEGGEVFYLNPFAKNYSEGKKYNISYTPYGKYIIRLEQGDK